MTSEICSAVGGMRQPPDRSPARRSRPKVNAGAQERRQALISAKARSRLPQMGDTGLRSVVYARPKPSSVVDAAEPRRMGMRNIERFALVASCSLVAVGGMVLTSGPAHAQAAGEVRCQDDGYIYSWNTLLNMWNNTFKKCEPRSSRSSRSRSNYDDDDEGDRNERRRARRDDDHQPSGQLATGDQKCSPDGYVMTYYAALKRWSKSSYSRC